MFKLFRREPGFYPKLVSLALPILLQNLITNSLGLVDTFMVGTMGEGPLAGVTLANIPVFVVQLMMFGIQSGSSVLISQYRGKGDMGAINRVMGIGMYAAGAIGLTFALIMGFLPAQAARLKLWRKPERPVPLTFSARRKRKNSKPRWTISTQK